MTLIRAAAAARLVSHSAPGDRRGRTGDMRWKGIVSLIVLGSLSAYYIYEPIPEAIDQKWKLMVTNSLFRALSHLVSVFALRVFLFLIPRFLWGAVGQKSILCTL